MNTTRQITAFALFAAATACAGPRAIAPESPATVASSAVAPAQLPLLYVVDGVRLGRDEVPNLDASQVSNVRVVKGRAALAKYGQDASYGVVLITTKQVATAR